jgi:hypothetical protein
MIEVRPICLAALVALTACARAPAPAAPPQPAATPSPSPEVEKPESPQAELDRFCDALARIVDAEPQRYASLRDEHDGPDRWVGQIVPARFLSCAVEGSSYPTASYVCHGETVSSTTGDLLEVPFEQIGGMIDSCLARPSWYPREWRRGKILALGGSGERQVTWRDMSVPEAPGLALNIESDILGNVYYLRLSVETVRLTQRRLVM